MCLVCLTRNVQRNAAADAPGKDPDIVPYEDEDLDTTQPDPNPQQQPVVGRGRSYCCG